MHEEHLCAHQAHDRHCHYFGNLVHESPWLPFSAPTRECAGKILITTVAIALLQVQIYLLSYHLHLPSLYS